MNGKIRAAVVAWKLRSIRTDGDFYAHYHDLVSMAHEEGAELVVFPENHSLELLELARDIEEEDVPEYLIQFADEIERWTQRIADSSGMTIVGGSYLRSTEFGIMNSSIIAVPDCPSTITDKNRLTTYERDVWKLSAGEDIKLPYKEFLAGLTCYDIEFPEAARALTDAGVLAIANPAFTENQFGFQRVRWSGQARATENQIFVLHSSLVGSLYREPVPSTYGSASILTPSAEPFPIEANLGETLLNEEGVIVRNLDFELLTECRRKGDVRNYNDRHPYQWKVTYPVSLHAASRENNSG